MVEEGESKESADDANSDGEAVEEDFAGCSEVEERVPKQQRHCISSEEAEDCGSEDGDLLDYVANEESDEERAGEDGPDDPLLGGGLQEGGVEQEDDDEDGGQTSANEEDRFVQFQSKETYEQTKSECEAEHNPLIFSDPFPEEANLDSAAHIRLKSHLRMASISRNDPRIHKQLSLVIIFRTPNLNNKRGS
mmetsp:Transcript_1530/g.1038  ORF Transcript_1530/g.1038 Transcript_1530/m.1038 type:complete len:192 (+) Transcript_1530:282-857(+)